MTYDTAIGLIAARLNALSGLPDVSDEPVHPEMAPKAALYLIDDEEQIVTEYLQGTDSTETRARPQILLKRTKTGSSSAAKLCRQSAEVIIADLFTYNTTKPDFIITRMDCKYAYDLANADWAAVWITLTLESYRN